MFLRSSTVSWHVWTVRLVTATSVVHGLVFFFMMIFQCKPVTYFWQVRSGGSCIRFETFILMLYFHSALTIASAWIFGTLPIFLVRRRQMNRATKHAACSLLIFVNIWIIITIVRINYVRKLTFCGCADASRMGSVIIFTNGEVGMGIFVACVATLRPLLRTRFRQDNHQAVIINVHPARPLVPENRVRYASTLPREFDLESSTETNIPLPHVAPQIDNTTSTSGSKGHGPLGSSTIATGSGHRSRSPQDSSSFVGHDSIRLVIG